MKSQYDVRGSWNRVPDEDPPGFGPGTSTDKGTSVPLLDSRRPSPHPPPVSRGLPRHSVPFRQKSLGVGHDPRGEEEPSDVWGHK